MEVSNAPAVEIVGISKSFGELVALDAIDLVVKENEFLSLLGPSGCGKTTLLRIIAGFERPTAGRVRIRGQDVTDVAPHRRPTNIVFQRGALFPHMNVAENIGYSLKLRGWPRARIAQKVEELLALVRLEGLGGRGPTQLSGGQVQRAALARALAAEPSVLLLDEPLSALDLKLRQHMQLELRALQRTLGATFVYVTHDQTEALVMSDRIAIMDRGRIVQEGTPRQIYTRPETIFASDFIGETNLLGGTAGAALEGDLLVALAPGTHVRAHADAPIAAGTAVTISVRPEAVRVRRLDAEAPLGAGELRGSVSELVYLGNRLRLQVETAAGLRLWADLRDEEAAGLAPGSEVAVHWSPGATSVWATSPDLDREDAVT
jgi:spermidine/putrescine ABC transporter ATP-binding subunit